MRDPYKVIVWGPGRMGGITIWEVLNSPAFELVGVRVYSDSKNGVDAGELVGVEPTGIIASNDVAALLEIECDCVVYMAHDEGTFHTDDEVLRILAAGKNIVTPLPYQNADLYRDQVFLEKLSAACETGQSVLYADGIDPHLIPNRILLGLTNGCADVQSVKLQEHWDCSEAEQGPLQYIGFGQPPEVAQKIEVSQTMARNFMNGVVLSAGKTLGVQYDRVEASHDYVPTPVDIDKPFPIKAGTVARITHRMEGFVDAIGTAPLFTIEYHWLIGEGMLPDGVQPGQYYVGTIEGRPSIKMALDFCVSHKSSERLFQLGNMAVEPSYISTVMPCLQAIPRVCTAEPGLMPTIGPGINWKQDLRDCI